MRLWRISEFADLSGRGGLFESARWHTVGRRIVYLSDHPASALLEVLVHLEVEPSDVPTHYQLLGVDVPDHLTADVSIVEESSLSTNWRDTFLASQVLGDAWLASGNSVLARVPSVIVPEAYNFLLNPDHAAAPLISIASNRKAPFDPRLFRPVRL